MKAATMRGSSSAVWNAQELPEQRPTTTNRSPSRCRSSSSSACTHLRREARLVELGDIREQLRVAVASRRSPRGRGEATECRAAPIVGRCRPRAGAARFAGPHRRSGRQRSSGPVSPPGTAEMPTSRPEGAATVERPLAEAVEPQLLARCRPARGTGARCRGNAAARRARPAPCRTPRAVFAPCRAPRASRSSRCRSRRSGSAPASRSTADCSAASGLIPSRSRSSTRVSAGSGRVARSTAERRRRSRARAGSRPGASICSGSGGGSGEPDSTMRAVSSAENADSSRTSVRPRLGRRPAARGGPARRGRPPRRRGALRARFRSRPRSALPPPRGAQAAACPTAACHVAERPGSAGPPALSPGPRKVEPEDGMPVRGEVVRPVAERRGARRSPPSRTAARAPRPVGERLLGRLGRTAEKSRARSVAEVEEPLGHATRHLERRRAG